MTCAMSSSSCSVKIRLAWRQRACPKAESEPNPHRRVGNKQSSGHAEKARSQPENKECICNQIACAEEPSDRSSSAHLGQRSIRTAELAKDQLKIPAASHHCCLLGQSCILWLLRSCGVHGVLCFFVEAHKSQHTGRGKRQGNNCEL